MDLKFATIAPTTFTNQGLFTFSDRISVRREVPDGAADDEGIAPAIAEEADAADGSLAADRKLTQKVNKPTNQPQDKTPLDGVLQGLKKHTVRIECGPAGKAKNVNVAKIVEGKETFLDTATFIQLDVQQPPDFPLTQTEMQALKTMIKRLPFTCRDIQLIHVLGFTLYASFCKLIEIAKTEKQRALYTFFETIVTKFCRFWVMGSLSILYRFKTKMRDTYTQSELLKEAAGFLTSITKKCEEYPQTCYKKHFDDAKQSLVIMSKLMQATKAKTFLLSLSCMQMQQFSTCLPRPKTNPEEHYLGIQSLIDFILCTSVVSQHIQVGADSTTAELKRLKTLYACIHHEHPQLSLDLLTKISEQRKGFLLSFYKTFEYEEFLDKQIAQLSKGKADATYTDAETGVTQHVNEALNRHYVAFQHCFYYRILTNNLMYLLEDYAKQSVPEHVTLHACLTQVSILQKLFACSVIETDALPDSSQLLSKLSFLSSSEKENLHTLCACMAQDIRQLFILSSDLREYALKAAEETNIITYLSVIREYKPLYLMLTQFFNTFCLSLDALRITHTQKLMAWVQDVSVETCKNHHKDILDALAQFLLICLEPFSNMALLEQNLRVLLPGFASPLNPLKDSMMPYLVMQDVEYAFFQIITPIDLEIAPQQEPEKPTVTEVSKVPESLLEASAATPTETEAAPMKPLEEKAEEARASAALTAIVATPKRENKSKVKGKGKKSKSKVHAPLPVMPRQAPLAHSLAPKLPLSFLIRIGEKITSIEAKLSNLPFDLHHTKGGHKYYMAPNGQKVTIPGHGTHLHPDVIKSLQNRVNDILAENKT